ncbi:MAG: AAA family ATPase [Elusimicrobia bacterium]|nr:AAA family ATPase [Elusimicrobiota bacterium]
MEELFNEQEIKQGKIEPLTKLPTYTSEHYINDILKLFYSETHRRKNIFELFKMIDERSMEEESDIDFIKEIKPYNLNIIERYTLIRIAIAQIRHEHFSRSDLVSELIELNIAKPITIINLIGKNSKLFKNKCIIYSFGLELNEHLFNLLITSKGETTSINNYIIDIKPNELYCKLNSYVIGQDNAIKNISAAVYEHIIKCRLNKDENKKDKIDKTNTLIIGQTGTGKTFICNTLSKILNIPIYIADASQLTETGYVGLSPESMFVGLLKECKQNMEGNKFPISIIYIDEIDKIAISKEKDGIIGSKSVQEEFLKIFESTTHCCFGMFDNREYDISNVMFILGGAFSGLEKIIEKRKKTNKGKSIGFFKDNIVEQDNLNILQQVTTEDLIEYGFLQEFIGRLPNKVILNALTKQDLIKILTKSQNNVITQYKQVFTEAGINLNILDETIEYVAEQAIKNNTGARGLKSILSSILNKILFETSSKGQKDFTLSPKEFSLFSNNI